MNASETLRSTPDWLNKVSAIYDSSRDNLGRQADCRTLLYGDPWGTAYRAAAERILPLI